MRWFVKENRRIAARHRYDGNNTWIQLEGSLTRQCQILDLSRTGVRLKVTNAHSLPDTFTLMLSKYSGGCQPARVKWRRGDEVGAEFFKADRSLISQSTAHAPRANSSSTSLSVADAPGAETQKFEGLRSTLSLHAGAQEPGVARSKPDAREVVGSISPDKAGSEVHRQTSDPGEQQDRVDQEKNPKKRLDLSRLQKKLGPDHVALIHALKDVDPESPHGRELASIIESLDENPDQQRAI